MTRYRIRYRWADIGTALVVTACAVALPLAFLLR